MPPTARQRTIAITRQMRHADPAIRAEAYRTAEAGLRAGAYGPYSDEIKAAMKSSKAGAHAGRGPSGYRPRERPQPPPPAPTRTVSKAPPEFDVFKKTTGRISPEEFLRITKTTAIREKAKEGWIADLPPKEKERILNALKRAREKGLEKEKEKLSSTLEESKRLQRTQWDIEMRANRLEDKRQQIAKAIQTKPNAPETRQLVVEYNRESAELNKDIAETNKKAKIINRELKSTTSRIEKKTKEVALLKGESIFRPIEFGELAPAKFEAEMPGVFQEPKRAFETSMLSHEEFQQAAKGGGEWLATGLVQAAGKWPETLETGLKAASLGYVGLPYKGEIKATGKEFFLETAYPYTYTTGYAYGLGMELVGIPARAGAYYYERTFDIAPPPITLPKRTAQALTGLGKVPFFGMPFEDIKAYAVGKGKFEVYTPPESITKGIYVGGFLGTFYLGGKLWGKVTEPLKGKWATEAEAAKLSRGEAQAWQQWNKMIKEYEHIKPTIRELPWEAVEKMPPRMQKVTQAWTQKHGEVTVGGYLSQRAQMAIKGRPTHDVDFYAPKARITETASSYYQTLKKAGFERVALIRKGTKAEPKFEITHKGRKIAEFHTEERLFFNIGEVRGFWRPSFTYIEKTPSGVRVLGIEAQARRKLWKGYFEPHRKLKDLHDVKTYIKSQRKIEKQILGQPEKIRPQYFVGGKIKKDIGKLFMEEGGELLPTLRRAKAERFPKITRAAKKPEPSYVYEDIYAYKYPTIPKILGAGYPYRPGDYKKQLMGYKAAPYPTKKMPGYPYTPTKQPYKQFPYAKPKAAPYRAPYSSRDVKYPTYPTKAQPYAALEPKYKAPYAPVKTGQLILMPKQPTPPPVPPWWPPEKKARREEEEKRRREQGYNTFVKRKMLKKGKGKYISRNFVRANRRPLTRKAAEGLGMEVTDTFANRSFRVMPARGAAQPSYYGHSRDALAHKFRPRKSRRKDVGTYVEKTLYSIDSIPEKRAIPYESARLRRGGTMKFKTKSTKQEKRLLKMLGY